MKLIRTLAAAALFACAACSALDVAVYDAIEQHGYAQLHQQARALERDCGTPAQASRVLRIREIAELGESYAMYQENEGTRELARVTARLVSRLDPAGGAVYCRESAKNLQDAAGRAMQSIARRQR